MSKQTIALVGGTGNLGTLIANAVLDKPDVQLRLLVRPGSREKTVALEKRETDILFRQDSVHWHATAQPASAQ